VSKAIVFEADGSVACIHSSDLDPVLKLSFFNKAICFQKAFEIPGRLILKFNVILIHFHIVGVVK
jgi:hypothetical protein